MILMNDFKREPEALLQAQLAASERVFRSGWLVLGSEVKAFEAEWSAWSGSAHTVGVGNGMDALEIGLRALGIGPGDEVVTTPMTAFATVLSILRAGATPVLADIDPETAILDPMSVRRCIGPRTKAVMVVHLYGQAAPMDAYQALCRETGILLLEDGAQSHGAKFGGKPVGTFGAFGGTSFYPTKNLGAIGDGGALVTESTELAERARQLRNYGQSVRYYHPMIGMNSRLDELQAAILRERLKLLTGWNSARRSVATRYAQGVRNAPLHLLPLPAEPERHVHHLCVLTSPRRDALMQHLKECGVESQLHYPVPVHHQESCRGIQVDPKGLPNAERHAVECLSIPCHPYLTDLEVTQVIEALNAFRA